LLPKATWTRASDTMILHGRRICRPRPLCDRCSVRADCDYYRSLTKERGASPRAPSRGWGPAPLRKERGASPRAPSRGWGPAPLRKVKGQRSKGTH
jgi:adenine-specific DNA glycosylase